MTVAVAAVGSGVGVGTIPGSESGLFFCLINRFIFPNEVIDRSRKEEGEERR